MHKKQKNGEVETVVLVFRTFMTLFEGFHSLEKVMIEEFQ